MKRAMSITLMLLLASSVAAFAKPADMTNTLEKFQYQDLQSEATQDQGVFNAAQPGTTFFGGTFWAADSGRWEAIVDSCWTFDTGVGSHFDHSAPHVNPFKDPSLHAYMEGWVGFDNTYSEITYFRRLSEAAFAGSDTCVGAGAGLGGSWSFWCGVLPDEADELCYAGGQGYGDAWNVCIGQTFAYASGNATLGYSYVNETEGGFDFSYAIVDTSGGNDEDVVLASYDGGASGTESLPLSPGNGLPYSSTGNIVVKFCFAADGAYSDQDGLNVTACGAFAVDDISLTGAISHSADFETGDDGWALLPAGAGAGGDWSHLVDIATLPTPLTPCDCSLEDSVLTFIDETTGDHNLFQDNLAASPWMDLLANGAQGPGKFIQADVYTDMPLLNYIFAQGNVQWYPEVCNNTGKFITSPFTSDGFVIYFGDVPACTDPAGGGVWRRNYGAVAAVGAEQMRLAIGMLSYCRFFQDCTNVSNTTPWFDNVKFGLFGDVNAPLISVSTVDTPQDNFPENGTLRIDAPGRLDSNNVKGQTSPEPGSSLGDTLIVQGGSGGAEVWVQFAVDPGPGVDGGDLASFLGNFTFQESKDGQDWYAARMDTAEQGQTPNAGEWMTAFHESEGAFSGDDKAIDPNDLPPNGVPSRLLNDMFPDDLFTAGTRINMFYKTKFIAGSTWFTFPDTANGEGEGYVVGTTPGGPYLEWECLPSSMDADSSFNCILYVDHFSGRGAQRFIEDGLGTILAGGSANFENTEWDRFDVEAPSSQQMSFGRPLNTEYGATVSQTLGYKAILWNTGNLGAFNLVKEDADVLIPWLSLIDFGNNNLYLSGNGQAFSMQAEAVQEPSALILLEDYVGVLFGCNTFRDLDCPVGGAEDTTACLAIDPVGGAVMSTRPLAEAPLGQGNGCPQLRSFDVINENPSASFGTASDEEAYDDAVKGVTAIASVSLDADGSFGPVYRTVLDGLSVHYRRDPGDCVFNNASAPAVTAIEGRLREVLGYFGFLNAASCEDPTASVDVPTDPRVPTFRTTLSNFAPNPLMSGATGRIHFTMERAGKATVDVFDVNGRLVKTVFDGVAKTGPNEVLWNGTDASERPVASGVYFYRLRSGSEDFSKKMIVVRNGN